ncbi:NB-ARC domain-containing protein [Corchorus capsularis]|uniref:NB-ARC domain-containing protein n=1 Tax=Corchorus capsularis TaxID=210143 RepID=A0A1R3IPI6_COCAP|nr:NB-ARC domain-containing protein [Corchorus capsularis]
MALKASKKHVKEILELFKQGEPEFALTLTGDARTGKTWMAREMSKSAIKEGCCYAVIWLSLDQKYEEKSLYKTIAHQLLLLSEEEWEDSADNKKKEESADDEKKEDTVENLKKKIKINLNVKAKDQKFLLLVLDSEGEEMTEDDISNDLGLNALLKENPAISFKVLITTKKSEEGPITRESKKVEPLCGEEASSLLIESFKGRVLASESFMKLSAAIRRRSNVLPDEIIMLAGALNYFAKDKSRASELGRALESAVDAAANVQTSLLQYAYDMLPSDCMINCFWHCWHFLSKHRGVNYNELIAHWILEGYLDAADNMEMAYEMGHHILMELIDRGVLRMQEDNMIAIEAATLKIIDHHCHGFSRLANLGLASVLEDEERKVFERIKPGNSMIKTLGGDKKEEAISSLVIDGSHLCRELPETFFQTKQHLKVLAIVNPRLKTFPFSDSKMENLVVLVLRGAYLLEDCKHIAKLKALKALEISGATYLEEIPDGLFNDVPRLRSLNLSALGIKVLPSSVSNLTELRRLIVRQCSCLEELPKLDKLVMLEVIDVSQCTSLKKIQDKCFKSQLRLQVLDFSETKIEKLPIVRFLKDLTRLTLRGCKRLALLRFLKALPKLKVVDLSGAVRIEEINDDNFENTENLSVLDLSYTRIHFLPSSISNLCHLKLKGCSNLQNLPSTNKLGDLESLDLSGATSLRNIQDVSFEHLKHLSYLNLSNTKVATLPSLCNLGNLRKLLLKDCSWLHSLPEMRGLIRLEVFDLSGCKALSDIPEEAFDDMSQLQELNLSETKIKHLPSFQSLRNLHFLVLRDCFELQSLPALDPLSELEVLDLSGTKSLNEVKAESLKQMTHLQTLKLSNLAFEDISFISNLINLHQLYLNDCSSVQTQAGDVKKPSLVVYSTKFFRRLKRDPKLLEATSKVFKQLIFSIQSSKLQCQDKLESQGKAAKPEECKGLLDREMH